MKYSICIFPNGIDKNSVELVFNDQLHKSQYIKQEAMYCRKEFSNYIGEMFDSNKRTEYKNAFYKKRVEFAKKNNFSPVNQNVWKQKFDYNTHSVA